jgi:hypothetical protein
VRINLDSTSTYIFDIDESRVYIPPAKWTFGIRLIIRVLYHRQVNLYDHGSDPDGWHGRHKGLY